MPVTRTLVPAVMLVLAGCSIAPFQGGTPAASSGGATPSTTKRPGAAPELSTPTEIGQIETEAGLQVPPPAPLPQQRPRTEPAVLSPASRTLVNQAQAQRTKGDFPGATVSLERALRIEPNNPLLWLEMGRLRMDQRNFAQAENMGRKSLSMSIGDDSTQAAAWRLIADSLRARGRNPEAEEAMDRSRALAPN